MVNSIIPQFSEEIPEEIEDGILYISETYGIAIHNCACGCKWKTATPLKKGEWTLQNNNGLITLRPSIGNLIGEKPHHAHYNITNNNIEWL